MTSWHCFLSDFGVLSLSGKDAGKFLQGQATCDILGLPANRTSLGALCTAKGRAYAVFRVLRAGDKIMVLLPTELLENVRKRLSMYVLRADVKIEDVSSQWKVLGLCGEKAGASLQALGFPPLNGDNETEGQEDIHAIRIPSSGEPRYLLLVEPARYEEMIRRLEGQGVERADEEYWRLEDIRAGLPSLASATAEEFVPQMLNLDTLGGISFNKGCYTGQEIIARTHYLGQLKRRMVRLVGETGPIPKAGDVLQAEGEEGQGMVVVSAGLPEGGFELLAVVNTSLDENTPLKTSGGASLSRAALPG